MVDVGVRYDHVRDVRGSAADLLQGRGHVLGDRSVDAGVDEEKPLVSDDQPLGEPTGAEDRGNLVDAGLDLLDRHV